MSRELDEACARALGDNLLHPGFFWTEGTTPDGKDGWDGFACPRCGADESMRARPCARHYSTDQSAARLLEDEIERRGLFNQYTFALGRQVGIADDAWQSRDTLIAITWLLLRATPEQRAQAFLEAVK